MALLTPLRTKLRSPHLLGIKDMDVSDIELIFQTADHFKQVLLRPIKTVPALRDLTIANLFFENSTRTKLSFELAAKRLSATGINFSAAASSVSKGESLVDTVNTILSMKVDMVVLRHPDPGAAIFLSGKVKAQIINAGDGCHEHPTQALLDAYSIREQQLLLTPNHASLRGKKVLILGDVLHSRVALSNIWCLQKLGASVMVCGPNTLIPPHIKQIGVPGASEILVEYKLDKALEWCDVVNVLRLQLERWELPYCPSIREYVMRYGLTQEHLATLKKEILILHPGPVNRGIELSAELADCPQAIILNQVENGVAIRMAVLYLLANHSEALPLLS